MREHDTHEREEREEHRHHGPLFYLGVGIFGFLTMALFANAPSPQENFGAPGSPRRRVTYGLGFLFFGPVLLCGIIAAAKSVWEHGL